MMCGSRRTRRRRSLHHGHHLIGHTTALAHESIPSQAPASSSSLIVCLECGTENQPESEFCIECGKAIDKCPISRQAFHMGDEYVQCPLCLTLFHAHHFDQWMETQKSDKCPYCGQALTQVYRGKIGVNKIYRP